MTLTRLLAAAILISSLPVIAQDRTLDRAADPTPDSSKAIGSQLSIGAPVANASRSWSLVAFEPADPGSPVNALDASRLEQYRYDQVKGAPVKGKNPFAALVSAEQQRQKSDIACLRIRSYVVARDSKDSDSTHPVSYSTCQPVERYGLKTTEMRSQTGGH